jgi:hypothetical protein
MLLLSLDDCGDRITGFVDAGASYRRFTVDKDGTAFFDEDFPKEEFRNLDHFQGGFGQIRSLRGFPERPCPDMVAHLQDASAMAGKPNIHRRRESFPIGV